MIDGKIISSAHKRKRQRITRDRRDDHKFSCVQIKGVLFALLPFIRAAVKPHESNQQNHDAADRNKKLCHIIFRGKFRYKHTNERIENGKQHRADDTAPINLATFRIDSFIIKHNQSSQNKSFKVLSSALQILRHKAIVGL